METVDEVEALARRVVASAVDVRDYEALKATLDHGVAQLGRLDIVLANAGITGFGRAEKIGEQAWRDMIEVNLTGVWHTVKAASRCLADRRCSCSQPHASMPTSRRRPPLPRRIRSDPR